MIKMITKIVNYLFFGRMGVKCAMLGGQKLYERPGGFFYLELKTEE